jgi:DNA-binding NarL/FixJ family response regulator
LSYLAEGTQEQPDGSLSASPITVLIADDHPVVIGGIRRALEGHDDIEVVGEAHSGPEVLQMIERRRPRLVLLDLSMPGLTGLECVEQITATWPDVKTVVLSACEERAVINSALAAGASAYVSKRVMSMEVASVLRQTSTGAVFHAATQTHDTSGGTPEPEPEAGLTAREQAILQAVAQGLTTAAISKQLWVSEHTVKFHLTNIYRKLGVPNRAGAIRYALAHQLVAA